MSWVPNDLCADADLVAYERTILSQHGALDWQAKRQKAIEDWLFPLLASAGFDPYRLRTRFQPSQVWASTAGVFTDKTSAAKDTVAEDINLATILAAGSDALYIGAPWQFRGLSVRMDDDVSTVAATLTVELWRDAWRAHQAQDVNDGTKAIVKDGKPFSKGGVITWPVPEDWVTRTVNGSPALYFARLRLSSAPTGAKLSQVSVIRRSALAACTTLRTLFFIFREARNQQDGPWADKADQYLKESEEAWQRVQPLLGREFDTETVDDTIDAEEATQTAETVSGGWTWDRA